MSTCSSVSEKDKVQLRKKRVFSRARGTITVVITEFVPECWRHTRLRNMWRLFLSQGGIRDGGLQEDQALKESVSFPVGDADIGNSVDKNIATQSHKACRRTLRHNKINTNNRSQSEVTQKITEENLKDKLSSAGPASHCTSSVFRAAPHVIGGSASGWCGLPGVSGRVERSCPGVSGIGGGGRGRPGTAEVRAARLYGCRRPDTEQVRKDDERVRE